RPDGLHCGQHRPGPDPLHAGPGAAGPPPGGRRPAGGPEAAGVDLLPRARRVHPRLARSFSSAPDPLGAALPTQPAPIAPGRRATYTSEWMGVEGAMGRITLYLVLGRGGQSRGDVQEPLARRPD